MKRLWVLIGIGLFGIILPGALWAQPLAGSYSIGGVGGNYPSFTEAIVALNSRGVSAPVIFNVYGSDYNEAIILNQVNGASSTNTITFLDASGTARINYTGPTAVDGVVKMSGGDHFIFDGIDLAVSGGNTQKCVWITNTSQDNRFLNATFTGPGFGNSQNYCVYMYGSLNNSNVFRNLTLTTAWKAFHLTSLSAASQQSRDILIENCTLQNIRTGVYCTYVKNLMVRDNDIQLSAIGSTTDGAYGLLVDTQLSGDSVLFYRNKVHELIAVGGGVGVGLARLKSVLGNVYLYNNFCYGFQTTGNSVVHGISLESGNAYVYFNSIRLDDIAGTGPVYLVYQNTGTGTHVFENNIFYSAEQTNTVYGYFTSLSSYQPDVLDYNVYTNFNGSNYVLAAFGVGTPYATLPAFQAGTAFEDHGLFGDPGFVSLSDLHIQPTIGFVSNVGLAIPWITDDIDAAPRLSPPDIGADEYVFTAPAADYAVMELLNIPPIFGELLPYSIGARVTNRGSAAQTDVPLRLIYQGVPQDTALLSLLPDETDTAWFEWTTPLAPDTGILMVRSFLPGDAVPANDSLADTVVVVGQAMSGPYEVGDGYEFSSLAVAVGQLDARGVAGPVMFLVHGGVYPEPLTIGPITGVNATNTVTFYEISASEPVEVTSSNATGTLRLVGANFILFDGIDIIATGASTRAVDITGNSDHNALRNGTLIGAGVATTSTNTVYINGGGNDYNRIENCVLRGGHYAFRAVGISGTSDVGNELVNCTIEEGKYGVYLERQNNTRITGCDIQPGFTGSNTEIYGINVAAHASGFISICENNRIHNFRTFSGANGIYTSAGAGLRAYNNAIYDFQVQSNGSVNGIRAGGGTVEFYYNSVDIGDVASTGGTLGINGFYESTASTVVTLKNNVIRVAEPTTASCGLNRSAGMLVSDYNAICGPDSGSPFIAGRDSVTADTTLAMWQAGTGRDIHSVSGDPGYMSATNLHVQPTIGLLNAAGTPVVGITVDYDGQTRGNPPDIGMDEYFFAPYPHDFAVQGFVDLVTRYTASQQAQVRAIVQNVGSTPGSGIPVSLLYNNVTQTTVYVNLLTAEIDTVLFVWTVPNLGYDVGNLRVQAFCPGDTNFANDSVSATVTIVGTALAGQYDLGGGSLHYPSFNAALNDMLLRGVGGEVVFNCYAGTYPPFNVPEIPGVSDQHPVTFRSVEESPATLASDTGISVLHLNGADHINFDGIAVHAGGAVNVCVLIDNGADSNSVRNAAIVGRDSTNGSTRGVKIHFLGNDGNLIDSARISGVNYGVRMEGGGSADRSSDLEVRNCTITGGNYGVYLDNVTRARVHDNDIQPSGDNVISVYGVYVSGLTMNDTVYVYNNRIHNLRHTYISTFPLTTAIYSSPGTGAGTVAYFYNNWIYDYSVSHGRIYGLYLGSGTSYVYHNSIRINNVAADTAIVGVHLGSSLTTATLLNNIIAIEEPTSTCVGIWRESGFLSLSDHNCFYGPGLNFFVGRDAITSAPSLAAWQFTGRDLNSVAGDPQFISTTDLHIYAANSLLSGAGTYLAQVAWDIDHEARSNPPDIGADEYGISPLPGRVTGLTAFPDVDTGNMILRWNPAVNAVSYRVLASPYGDFDVSNAELVGTTTDTTFVHTGALLLATPRLYYFVITSSEPPAPLRHSPRFDYTPRKR